MREKQNHIEQLLIERDLDRHDAENQVLMYQKDISQVGIYIFDRLNESNLLYNFKIYFLYCNREALIN